MTTSSIFAPVRHRSGCPGRKLPRPRPLLGRRPFSQHCAIASPVSDRARRRHAEKHNEHLCTAPDNHDVSAQPQASCLSQKGHGFPVPGCCARPTPSCLCCGTINCTPFTNPPGSGRTIQNFMIVVCLLLHHFTKSGKCCVGTTRNLLCRRGVAPARHRSGCPAPGRSNAAATMISRACTVCPCMRRCPCASPCPERKHISTRSLTQRGDRALLASTDQRVVVDHAGPQSLAQHACANVEGPTRLFDHPAITNQRVVGNHAGKQLRRSMSAPTSNARRLFLPFSQALIAAPAVALGPSRML